MILTARLTCTRARKGRKIKKRKYLEFILRAESIPFPALRLIFLFRCEDILTSCSFGGEVFSYKDCCKEIFSEPIYTVMGRCISTHEWKMSQNHAGLRGGLSFRVKSAAAGRYIHHNYLKPELRNSLYKNIF